MKRREALKTLGFGMSATALLPWLSSCTDKDTGPEIRYDGVVGIVGAGVAGLFAAEILASKGIKVRIFEASDKIGGRIRSIKIFDDYPIVADFPVELGADQVIGTNSIWGEFMQQMKVPLINVGNVSDDAYILDGLFKAQADVLADGDFAALDAFRSTSLPSYTGVANVLDASGAAMRVQGIANSWLGNLYGTSASRIGAQGLGEALTLRTHDGVVHTLSNNPMHDVLISRFYKVTPKVELNRAITSINYAGDAVILTDAAGQQETVNFLIVTVPAAILKNNSITFTPALPAAKTNALSRIGMDNSIRIILEFKKNFWGTSTGFVYGGTTCPSYFSAGVGRSDFNRTLSLTINGAAADALTPLSDEQKVVSVLAELDAVFDGEATQSIRRDTETNQMLYVVKDWSQEPFIAGGYSYPKPGSTNADRVTLAAAVNNKLYFAGEAMDTDGDFGTINGAMNAAEKAALAIVDNILAAS